MLLLCTSHQGPEKKKLADVAAVYVPPRFRKKAETTEFLISSVFLLLVKFGKIKFIICGDINNLDIKTDAVSCTCPQAHTQQQNT